MMDLQPTLIGPRLELRPLRAEDFDALYAAASDPKIWELHPASDRWKKDVFAKYFQGGLDSKGAFAIRDRARGAVIGSSRYYDYSAAKSEVAVGFTFLTRPYWGGSYNGELKRLMLDHAFRSVDRVIFHVGEGNLRSRRAVEKIGGVLVDELTRPADSHKTVVYAIEKGRWTS